MHHLLNAWQLNDSDESWSSAAGCLNSTLHLNKCKCGVAGFRSLQIRSKKIVKRKATYKRSQAQVFSCTAPDSHCTTAHAYNNAHLHIHILFSQTSLSFIAPGFDMISVHTAMSHWNLVKMEMKAMANEVFMYCAPYNNAALQLLLSLLTLVLTSSFLVCGLLLHILSHLNCSISSATWILQLAVDWSWSRALI